MLFVIFIFFSCKNIFPVLQIVYRVTILFFFPWCQFIALEMQDLIRMLKELSFYNMNSLFLINRLIQFIYEIDIVVFVMNFKIDKDKMWNLYSFKNASTKKITYFFYVKNNFIIERSASTKHLCAFMCSKLLIQMFKRDRTHLNGHKSPYNACGNSCCEVIRALSGCGKAYVIHSSKWLLNFVLWNTVRKKIK